MKGHVPTPDDLADHIVQKLFRDPPEAGDTILYPGCGKAPFVAAVERWCNDNNAPTPEGTAIELDPEHLSVARERHADRLVTFAERDFLADVDDLDEFDYIVGNPPYVPIEGLDEQEKQRYKSRFDTAIERFDLYILFFEQSLNLLAEDGRLSFITPEKFEYVSTGSELRTLLASYHIEEIEHVAEDAFGELLTYPAITTIEHTTPAPGETTICLRDGTERTVTLPGNGDSWASTIRGGVPEMDTGVTLGDITTRVSCGVATGADSLFVQDEDEVPPQLIENEWTYPTTSGRQLLQNDGPDSGQLMICPYDERGNLASEDEIGVYGDWAEINRERLEDRSCVEKGKAWYSMHENPPMEDILRPKILTKDVTEEPMFWSDDSGEIVPRHSVYYIIPDDNTELNDLLEYLNSEQARTWIEANAQKAHNDYYRIQSKVLKNLPVPQELGESHQATLPGLD
ncbi:TaqI-like C-terminal specificity domain-containing protein [Halorubrum ezzemoulense]|uniref:Eco57I restriction-modification methylase domain-containing protein n=1 Tax=Halorubrum ezzemoulense TaxID=337243 RepID=UPI00232C4AB8|nr:TaqI-like C-terminal specificity domain-containing protein [Halorubrum ezzemoulense]MDB2272843.1 TaqI-like C-terminal specificity domain-containing protein [Halorubrum ezzemoulense]MDB9235718.1 TaqI-like C-terminal specificity domain-containing protein [Halorubrum ezzemoulense]